MSEDQQGDLRLIWLQAFLVLVEAESFTKAAKILKCNQSSISRYIFRLELWLGYKLILCPAPLKLSNEGQDFQATAQQVVEKLQNSRAIGGADMKSIPMQSEI